MGITFSQIISIIMAVFTFFPPALSQHFSSREYYVNLQKERVSALEAYYEDDSFVPVSEQSFASFNLPKALDENIKFNQLQFLATHNSYKQQINPSAQALINKTYAIFNQSKEDENSYFFEPLTEQFNKGIRSIEIDVMQCGGNLRVCHIPIFDMNSSCYDLKTALKEIKLWSDYNPSHLPITILIEPKVAFLNEGTIFHKFSLSDAKLLDSYLEEGLGDSLYTPKDMMNGYVSFKELRETIGSVPLQETLGKVMVIFHPSSVTDDYYNADESLMTQKMFPSVSSDKENALFVLENNPYSENIASLVQNNFIVRTRADSFLFYSDEKREKAVESGAQIISSDYPPSDISIQNKNYIAYLKDQFTIISRGIS